MTCEIIPPGDIKVLIYIQTTHKIRINASPCSFAATVLLKHHQFLSNLVQGAHNINKNFFLHQIYSVLHCARQRCNNNNNVTQLECFLVSSVCTGAVYIAPTNCGVVLLNKANENTQFCILPDPVSLTDKQHEGVKKQHGFSYIELH